MFLFVFLAILMPSDQGLTLGDLISIEKLETGTESERLNELDKALDKIDVYEFTATPNEFRIVVECTRHNNFVVQATSVRLLQRLTKKTVDRTVTSLLYKRDKNGIVDEDWSKIAFQLGHHKQIPRWEAYQSFLKHYSGRRCGGMYRYHRPDFDFESHIQTKDLATLQYAIRRTLFELRQPDPPSEFQLSDSQTKHLRGLIESHPKNTAADLARELFQHLEEGEAKKSR